MMIYFKTIFGFGALSAKMLLVRIMENKKFLGASPLTIIKPKITKTNYRIYFLLLNYSFMFPHKSSSNGHICMYTDNLNYRVARPD